MGPDVQNSDLLSSWKEIAAYLKCSVRTCLRWESETGLPVHRSGDSQRSRVYAYKNELDEWLKNNPNHKANKSGVRRLTRKHGIWITATFSVVILFTLNLLVFRNGPMVPADFRIEGSVLVILDSEGQKLWDFDTGLEDLRDELFYRDHYQARKPSNIHEGAMSLPLLIIKDINGDNNSEVLFSLATENQYKGDRLYCFSHKGKEIWNYKINERVKCGREQFADFMIQGFIAEDLNSDSSFEIIVLSHAVSRYPTQLSVLNNRGIQLSEYWNTGHISDVWLADINNDNVQELLLGGQNNGYRKPCLIVVNPFEMRGRSPQTEDRYCIEGMDLGLHIYYILLPRTDVDLIEHVSESIAILRNTSVPSIIAEAGSSRLVYEFDYNFDLIDVTLSHSFLNLHKTHRDANRVNSVPDEQYVEKIKESILYFDGMNFVSYPARNKHWEER